MRQNRITATVTVAVLTAFVLAGAIVFRPVGDGASHGVSIDGTPTVGAAGLPTAETEAATAERADLDQLMGVVFFVLLLAGATAAVSLGGLIETENLGSLRRRAVEVMLGAPLGLQVGQATGAWRSRLLRGCALGFVLAIALLGGMAATAPPTSSLTSPGLLQPGLAVLMILAAAILLIVAPIWALHRSSGSLGVILRQGAGSEPPTRRFRRVLLLTFQLSVAAALLTAAGLLSPQAVTNGVDPDRAYAAILVATGDSAVDVDLRSGLFGSALTAVNESPGLDAESLATPGAWIDRGPETTALNECGRCFTGLLPHPIHAARVKHHVVMPGFFEARGLELLDGRLLTRIEDGADGDPVVVINESYARAHFQDGPVPGRGFALGALGGEWHQVIGVVKDFADDGLGRSASPFSVYFSALQHPPDALELIARIGSGEDPQSEAEATVVVGEAVAGGGLEDLSVVGVTPVAEDVERIYGTAGWLGMGTQLLGWVAAVIAVLSLLAVMATHVRSRTGELGARAAVGASPQVLSRLVLGEAAKIGSVGIGIGLWGATAIVGILGPPGGPLFETGLFAAVGGLLLAGALVAALPGASEAGRVEPAVALAELGG